MPSIDREELGLFRIISVSITPVSAERFDAVSVLDNWPVETRSFDIEGMPYVYGDADC
jgi:hypothetical protein